MRNKESADPIAQGIENMPDEIKEIIIQQIVNGSHLDVYELKKMMVINKSTSKLIQNYFFGKHPELVKIIEMHDYTSHDEIFATIISHLVNLQYIEYRDEFIKHSSRSLQDIVLFNIGDKLVKITFKSNQCTIKLSRGKYNTTTEVVYAKHIVLKFNINGHDIHNIRTSEASVFAFQLENDPIDIKDILELGTTLTLREILTKISPVYYEHGVDGQRPYLDLFDITAFKWGNFKCTVDRRMSWGSTFIKTITRSKTKNTLIRDISRFIEFLRQDNDFQTEFVRLLQEEKEKDKHSESTAVSVLAPIDSSGPRIQTITTIPLLGNENANLIMEYENITGKQSTDIMRFYNRYLEQNHQGVNQKQKENQITRTLTTWKSVGFSQPTFENKVVQMFPGPVETSDEDGIDVTKHSLKTYDNHGIFYSFQYHDYVEKDLAVLYPNIQSWVEALNNGNKVPLGNTSELPGFEFYPLLPMIGQGAGGDSIKKYTRTKERTLYCKIKHVIYTGKRGGKYIYLNEKYVPISKLKQ